MFELGKTEAKIEDLENRIREHADHEHGQDKGDLKQTTAC